MKPKEKLAKFIDILKYRMTSIKESFALYGDSEDRPSVRTYKIMYWELDWALGLLTDDRRLEELLEFYKKHYGGVE